jgi:hypothetical protein
MTFEELAGDVSAALGCVSPSSGTSSTAPSTGASLCHQPATHKARGTMAISSEQRLKDACERFVDARDRFVAEVLEVTQQASIEAIERAFALALATRAPLPTSPPGNASATTDVVAGRTPTAEEGSKRDSDLVLACVRQAPGSHVGQLSQALARPASNVRRHLRQLVIEEAIRIADTSDPRFGGQRRQTFFPREPGSTGTASQVTATEASA